MDNHAIDRFFYYASRFVIAFPIIALALILLVAKNPFEKREEKRAPTPAVETKSKKESLNLNASYVCNIPKNRDSSTSAYIKNKSVRVTISKKGKTSHTLFLKDCLYSWQEGKLTGEKTCGLGQYVSLIENFGNLTDPQSLFESFFEKVVPTATGSAGTFEDVCKEQKITDGTLFEVPKGVKFTQGPRK